MSTDYKPLSDEEVILRLQQDDFAAYDELVRRYRDRLYGFIQQMVRNPPLAEDILQDTFIRLWQHRMSYRTIARFSTWLYTIAANLVRSQMRKQSRVQTVDLEPRESGDRAIELPDGGRGVDEIVESRITVEKVRRAMEQLPDEFREVIILREIEELSYEEIVELLNLPLGTVKSRINRARGRLRELLTNEFRELRR
jgi:RNA polymerase sigma-70 factor, ECF subfamily